MSDDEWFPVRKLPVRVDAKGPYTDPTVVDTIEGDFEVDEDYIEEHGGYYLIRGVEGEVYPCSKEIFESTYERMQPSKTYREVARNSIVTDAYYGAIVGLLAGVSAVSLEALGAWESPLALHLWVLLSVGVFVMLNFADRLKAWWYDG